MLVGVASRNVYYCLFGFGASGLVSAWVVGRCFGVVLGVARAKGLLVVVMY